METVMTIADRKSLFVFSDASTQSNMGQPMLILEIWGLRCITENKHGRKEHGKIN